MKNLKKLGIVLSKAELKLLNGSTGSDAIDDGLCAMGLTCSSNEDCKHYGSCKTCDWRGECG